MKIKVTQELVKSIFEYREDGHLIWKIKYSQKVIVGTVAGYKNPNRQNREAVQISYNLLVSSRVIFLWHHGWLPDIVDHIDRNPENNRIENLRAATNVENSINTSSRKNSTSKYLGVYYDKSRSKWMARIKVNRIDKNIGRFNSENEAALAWNKMAIIHYGEFANLNSVT